MGSSNGENSCLIRESLHIGQFTGADIISLSHPIHTRSASKQSQCQRNQRAIVRYKFVVNRN